jgi:hypothetical protein
MVICTPPDFELRLGYKDSLFVNPFLCFFFASSLLFFFFPPTLAPHYEQLTLNTTTLNDEYRVTLASSASCSCPSLTYHGRHLPFAALLLFFLDERMGWQRM